MLMRRSGIKRIATVLAALLLIAVAVLPVSARAEGEANGEIRVRLRASDGEMIPDYTIALFKVADYSGEDITLTPEFAACGLTQGEVADGQSGPETAEKLESYLEEHEDIEPLATAKSGENGYAVFTGVPDGLYFICGAPVEETEDEYAREVDFGSFIVAMPTFNTTTGSFVRRVECMPKSEITHLLGDLVIRKTLLSFAGYDDAVFVFSVKAYAEDENGVEQLVYDNVVSIRFGAAGTNEYRIENKIPVGARVVVEEIYSGAVYTAVGDTTQTAEIVLDKDGAAPATVSFTNDYDDGDKGGGGVLNEFTYSEDGGWTVTKK